MTTNNSDDSGEGLDLAGFGKIAKAIPDEVYTRSARSIITTFEKLVAPLTESTSGLGRYIRQKFDTMVEAEKAIATYTLEQACMRAEDRIQSRDGKISLPTYSKSFVKSLEEASKETDPLLHEMWVNLIASQMTEGDCHPHFVEVLSHLSPFEAKLLIALRPREEAGELPVTLIPGRFDRSSPWKKTSLDPEVHPWTYACTLLCELRMADIASTKEHHTVLFRTDAGNRFLAAVSP